MLIVISPAKSLNFESPPAELGALGQAAHTRPRLLDESAELIAALRLYTPDALAQLMDLSPALATINSARYQAWLPTTAQKKSRQALFAFDGDVYGGLDAKTLSLPQLDWAQQHLCILSGLYGLLKPLDRIMPHRLEMGSALPTARGRNLYAFWGDTITQVLNAQLQTQKAPVLINLASTEYFKSVNTRALKAPVVECRFEERRGGAYKIISFSAKRARGLMARYAIARKASKPEQLQAFCAEGYAFDATASSAALYVFRRESSPAAV
jgi:uncharacterized protein